MVTDGGAGRDGTPTTRRRVTRPTATLLVGYAFGVTMIGTTLPTPLYPIYRERLGVGAVTTTVVFAVYALGVVAALLLVGRLSDQIGRRPVLLAGLALSAVSGVVFLLPGGLVPLYAGRVLSGLSAGIFTGTATAALLDLAPAGRRARAGLAAASVNMLGLGLGPVVAGVLAEYAPGPLVAPYVASLVLLAPAVLGVLVSPEPISDPRPLRGERGVSLRPERLRVPASARPVFVRAVVAGFAGFAVLGLFTAVSPSFVSQVIGIRNSAVEGLVVFSLLAASTVGQLASARVGERRALIGGSVVLAAGALVIAGALLAASLPLLVGGAVVAGLGQGASFRAGLSAVGAASPADQRSEVSSSFFVAIYVALSIPVIGVGVAAQAVGLVAAGVGFSVAVALLALAAFVALLRQSDQESAADRGVD